jgi:hypothetical protein
LPDSYSSVGFGSIALTMLVVGLQESFRMSYVFSKTTYTSLCYQTVSQCTCINVHAYVTYTVYLVLFVNSGRGMLMHMLPLKCSDMSSINVATSGTREKLPVYLYLRKIILLIQATSVKV